ncbi:MAG: pyridoxal phosphate-dependent aminotransferase [Oligoflexales bacterium]
MAVNPITENLDFYPMEELSRIKAKILKEGKRVFDFGTGDPAIPTWTPIKESLLRAVKDISQYPSISGCDELTAAINGYLKRRLNFTHTSSTSCLPTNGSKEAIFHVALSLVGRQGKKRIVYPNPGYPVYKTSIQFAGGIPVPFDLTEDNDYMLNPWELPLDVQKDVAAVWINYPHNPTSKTADASYFEKLIRWAREYDAVILSDDCYIDIYFDEKKKPLNILQFDAKNTLAFFSLSKRSGLTGYRSGFMAGDKALLEKMKHARANFGVATPSFIQAAAITAWGDDQHVEKRKNIFKSRAEVAYKTLSKLGMVQSPIEATFYFWCNVPAKWKNDDVKFAMDLAENGVITSPSSWLGEDTRGYVRFALVPEENEIQQAMDVVAKVVKG